MILSTIKRIYQAALDPGAYDSFIQQWDSYLAAAKDDERAALTEHIDQALAIVERLDHAGERDISPQRYAATLPGPAAIIDRTGTVSATNAAWRAQHAAALTRLWPLAAGTAEEGRIRNAIQEIASAIGLPVHVVSLEMRGSDERLHLSFRRLPISAAGETGLIVVRSDRGEWDDGLSTVWQREFALTPAEIDLLRDLCGGDSFARIADRRGKSRETLRAQSKSLYRKMSVGNREAAVMLAMRLHVLAGSMRASLTEPRAAGEARFLTLASGRQIAVIDDGDRRLRPLPYIHGMTLGHGFAEALPEQFAQLGWRVVRIERPGYGRSDPPAEWRQVVEEWVRDFPSLLDGLGIDHGPIMTHTSGIMYGCAAAAAHPARVDGIFAISGGIPITDPAMVDHYPTQLRRVARTAQISPRALRFFLTASANYIALAGGEDRFIQRSYGQNPVDAAVLEKEATAQKIRDGLKLLRDGGYNGFVGDALRIFDDWSDWIAALHCPLVYATGTEDRYCPIDWARSFAQRYPHVFVEEIAGAAQLAQHTHPAAIAQLFGEFTGRIRVK